MTLIGSHIKKLIAHKMSFDAIPPDGGFADGVDFILDEERFKATARVATEWVQAAIRVLREAKEPNPWKDLDDEAIAGDILRRVEEKRTGKNVKIED